jgi:hypothetical protein
MSRYLGYHCRLFHVFQADTDFSLHSCRPMHTGFERASLRVDIMRQFLLVVAMQVSFAAPASANICQAQVHAAGQQFTDEARAQTSSIHRWRQEVSGLYGASYASWSLAESKRVVCVSRWAGKAMVFGCKARGKPCTRAFVKQGLPGISD